MGFEEHRLTGAALLEVLGEGRLLVAEALPQPKYVREPCSPSRYQYPCFCFFLLVLLTSLQI